MKIFKTNNTSLGRNYVAFWLFFNRTKKLLIAENWLFDGFLSKASKTTEKTDTGCFKANIYTLTNDYDKYAMCMCTEKIVVDLFSVYVEISFHGNKLENNNCLCSKNLNWKLGPFFP